MSKLFLKPEVFPLLVQICLGGLASFFAILSWTYTRHGSWLFVVLGILSMYASVLYKALRFFGVFLDADFLIFGTPLSTLLSDNISILLFIIACILYIKDNK